MKLIECDNLFTISYGGNFSTILDYPSGNIPVVKSQATNNGVIGFFNIEPNYARAISVARTGSIGSSFFHDYPCYITDDCMVLVPKKEMCDKTMLIYASILQKNSNRYNYSRKITPTRLGSSKIPDLKEIQKYLSSIDIPEKPTVKSISNSSIDLDARKWKWFEFEDIFSVKKGKRLTKENMIDGGTLFIGAIDGNNGLSSFIQQTPIFKANTISVVYNGNGVAEAFYQSKPYWASDDVNVLYPKFEMNIFNALFLTTLIRLEKYRFSYGRKWHKERMEKSKIKLPIDKKGNPDWQFMREYIEALPYSAAIKP